MSRRLFGASLLLLGTAAAQEQQPVTIWARLLAPLTTKFSRKGDMVSARVLEPPAYKGGILEGEVQEVRAGGAEGKPSYLQFEFRALHKDAAVLPLSASLVQAVNSRHQSDVDEEGAALETGARGVTGKLFSVFSRGSAASVRLAARAPNLSFLPGSEFVLQVQFRKER